MRIDSPSAETLDIISDEKLIQILRDRGILLPVSLEAVPEDAAVQIAREKRILRLLPRVSQKT